MEIYLDNSSTTKPYDEVVKTVTETMSCFYANPSSLHSLGKKCEDLLNNCRNTVASVLNCKDDEVFFTGGGTESNNIAIIGSVNANKRRGNKIITTQIEHMSVLEPFSQLEKNGFEVVKIPANKDFGIDMDALEKELCDDVILVSCMMINNETGVILPTTEISKLIKKKAQNALFHADAVQAFGKIPTDVKKLGVDMLSISSHKIHGPNGVGALYIKSGSKVSPVIFGGQQEKSLCSGTENLAAIAGFETACKIKFKNFDSDSKHIADIKKLFIDSISDMEIEINTPKNSASNILNVSFLGTKAEVMLHILESNNIYVSTGSACNSKKTSVSHVLKAMGLKKDALDSAIRFSFSAENTKEDILYTANCLKKEVPILKKVIVKR